MPYIAAIRPTAVIDMCVAAHRRLEDALGPMTDQDTRQPSMLPGWTRAHVLAHLAAKTKTHVWLFGGAAANEVRQQYPSGYAQAQAEVEGGSARSADELKADLTASLVELEDAWEGLAGDHWGRQGICVPGPRSMVELVERHMRDVEVHHVDLDIGYSPSDWPPAFVQVELTKRLAGLAQRADHATLLAWLLGRGQAPELGPW